MSGPEPQPGILGITPYRGGEGTVVGHALASNENPHGAGSAAREAYRAASARLHLYPEGGAEALRAAIAQAHGLDPARIVCGNGSDELIGLLCHAYAGVGDEVLHTEHGFLMYRLAALAAGAVPVAAAERGCRADIDAILGATSPATRLVFLANPNNPTGSWLERGEVERLADGLSARALLVLDAAYAEYVDDPAYEAGASLVEARPDVVMTRTFSKIHGLAGLRIGWAYCPPGIADVLNRIRGPFNANRAGQEAAAAAVADRAHVETSLRENRRLRAELAAGLTGLGIRVWPSVTNFVLAEFASKEAMAAANAALREGGIYVRRMEAYGLPACLRITVGSDAAVQDLLEALGEHFGKASK